MGVHGLWDLLAPIGRRVSVETLAGKKLAIDASIWMVQFMKAMRDEKGEMVRNAHLLGFFRRICKLLYLRTKPVFVFDGGTPALKRRTVIARRRQRENSQAKIRKTAEKLLLNHLKSMRLKDLAKDLEEQRKGNKEKKKVLLDGVSAESARDLERDDDYVKLDEMVAASIAAEEGRSLNNFASTSGAGPASEEVDTDEEMLLPGTDGNIDPDVLAVLPPSMQLDLMMREGLAAESRKGSQGAKQGIGSQNRIKKDKAKGKQVLSDQSNVEGTDIETQDDVAGRYNQENLDEMLAASLMADQDGGITKNASMFTSAIPSEEDDGDDEEEMIMPHGNVDPAVLAALPPSMQLDLLVQMRERLMAENRQRYQKVKKAPEKFSELQIESYLKTVAFRREIDQVQRAAAGKGVGGVQTSRIASEANREFIFSKSFTGDKELLMSAGVKGNGDKQQQKSTQNSIDLVDSVASTDKSNITTGFVQDESRRAFDDEIETYLDESGRVRVSRLRAMGMRMTRDLQRNLDLIKEVEQDRTNSTKNSSTQSALETNMIVTPKSSPIENQLIKTKDSNITDFVNLSDKNESFLSNNEASIEISFEVDNNKCLDSDDDIFASLVAGKSVKVSPADNSLQTRQPSFSASDDDWEEGIIEQNGNMSSYNAELTPKPSGRESNAGDDSEVEWEERAHDVHENSLHPAEAKKPVSRGYLAEDADLQEAIRRSLEDQGRVNFNVSSKNEKLKSSVENTRKSSGLHDEENIGELKMLEKDVSQQKKLFYENSGIQKMDGAAQASIRQDFPSPGKHFKLSEGHDPDIVGMLIDESGQLKSSEAHNPDAVGMLIDEPCIQNPGFGLGQSSQDTNEVCNLDGDLPSCEPVIPLEAKDVRSNVKQSSETLLNKLSTSTETSSGKGSHISEAVFGDLSPAILDNDGRNDTEGEPSTLFNGESINSAAELSGISSEKTKRPVSFVGPAAKNPPNGCDSSLGQQKYYDDQFTKETSTMHKSEIIGDESAHFAFAEATLEEEMLILDQESMKLGDEQRKHERNAESVSSEMFTECQELLQMFGLPYIVAPMEAEAQCAYMELANLVDGVVTDDSDVFLFGARSVYKNIFDDRKYVETYFMKDIEKELGLTREQLVLIALLLGSDYTEGISGIGIVNAIEVVHAFPEEDGLHRFRKWVESPDPNILGKFNVQSGLSAKKKVSKVGANDVNCANNDVDEMVPSGQDVPQTGQEKQSVDQIQKVKQIFMDKHRNVSKNWHIPSSFPSEAVISAYSSPQVDKSTEPFTWGKPDLHVLQRLCWEKFGWGVQKSNELLMPVLKEYEKRETQLRLEAFYTFNERFAKIRSKRIKSALKGITGNKSMDLMDEPVEELSKGKRKKKSVVGTTGDKEHEELVTRTEESGPGTKTRALKKSNAKQSRKRQNAEEPLLSGKHQTNKASKGNGRGKGRTRGKGRGRGKVNVGFELSDSSSDDVCGSDEEQEAYTEKSESPRNIRRSSRSRKPVSYLMNELDLDDADKSIDQGDKKSTDEGTVDEVLFGAQGVSGGVNVEQDKVVDPSLNVDFPMDLERGGGFCNDEYDVGWADASQNARASKGDISGDYLKMGGGFCVDEDETGKEEDGACTSPAAVQEIADSSTSLGHMDDAEAGNGSVHSISTIKKRSNEPEHGGTADIVGKDNNKDSLDATTYDASGDLSKTNAAPESTGASSVGGLSAMPFLKRKRRRT